MSASPTVTENKSKQAPPSWVIFSDFDGTITEMDAIVMTMERFAPPQWKTIATRILKERSLSVKEGIQALYALMPSDLKQEIIRFMEEELVLRAGFSEFMAWRKAQAIPFQVVSGGLDAFILPALKAFEGDYTLFSNIANFQKATIQVEMPYAPVDCAVCNSCACCKVMVLNQWDSTTTFKIAVGDSVTDFGMAKVADWVFARDALAEELQHLGLSFTPYETFNDIQQALEQRWHETTAR
ncbi:MAG: MtnX-like HAD-IB family phosphatase [Vampirovibrio sp.]